MSRERRLCLILCLAALIAAAAIAAVAILSSVSGLRIVELAPMDGQDGVPITAPIRIVFSRPVTAAGIESHFSIQPEILGRLIVEGKEATFGPQSALAPGTTYTVTLRAGASSQRGHTLREDHSWVFSTRDPQVLYLGRPFADADYRQLFVASPGTAQPRQLTDHPGGVWDLAVHPQGEEVVYSVLREDGGSDLWRMGADGKDQRLLLACPGAGCLNPAWSPDGGRVAYERRDIWADAPNLDPEAGRIWLLDLERGDDGPLFDYDVPLHSPVWAPEGERLAYVSPVLPGVEVYDLGTEELYQFGNEWGAAPVWSPDGSRLVMPELMLDGEVLVVRLVRVDVEREQVVDISGGLDEEPFLVKDVGPAWSPGGGWIAFGRRFLDEERWTPGREIWLTRPDAEEAYSLFPASMGDHFALSWRPDGGALVYVRADLSEGPQPVPDVSIWAFDFALREPLLVASEGVSPRWLP